jgi:nucleoside-diphosphate kinase
MFKFLIPFLMVPVILFGTLEETITIIKPNAVKNGDIGHIISRYEKEGFDIKEIKMTKMSKSDAEMFYMEHKGKPFFEELTTYMSSGPVVVLKVQGDGAIYENRQLIGDTNPQTAKPETLRALYGQSKARNSLHGSDSLDAANREIEFFFKGVQ